MGMNVLDNASAAAAKAAYIAIHSGENGENATWAEAAWEDMGGSEPCDERANLEVAMLFALRRHYE